jgi:class 3 adenylate cyclase
VIPETRYAKTTDGVHIAYQTLGQGPPDLVLVTSFLNVEQIWRWDLAASFLRRLATFSRLLLFDRRGTGLSDHIVEGVRQLTLEARMDDIRALMDSTASERAVLLGIVNGFPLSAMFAATYPERTAALIAYGADARRLWAPEYPWGDPDDKYDREVAEVERAWGTLELAKSWAEELFPDFAEDSTFLHDFAGWMRHGGGGPGDAVAWLRVDWDTDVRDLLATIRVPTLVMHRSGDRARPVARGRYVAEHIPGARMVEFPGKTSGWVAPDQDELLDEIERFVAELQQEEADFDRVLATVLFTDIVGSTARTAKLGDRAWQELVERHHVTVRGLLARYRGTEVDTAGDGFFATFDGPARAVRCALAIGEAVRPLGLEVRAGVHTGEVETINGKIGGLAVNIGARIGRTARPSEVLASSTVKDLTAGSGLVFDDRGEHDLKGVPGEWRLYAVMAD